MSRKQKELWQRYKDRQPYAKDRWVLTLHTYRTRPSTLQVHHPSPNMNDTLASRDAMEFGHIYWRYIDFPTYEEKN